MWTFVYFSAEAGRVESCQDAALSLSQQVGQWAECERGRGPDCGQGRWKTYEARGEGRVKQRTDRRRDQGRAEVVDSGKWRMEGWMESNREEGERQTPSTGYRIKGRTNEHWGFIEPYRKWIRDGWIHAQAGRREKGIQRRTHIKKLQVLCSSSFSNLIYIVGEENLVEAHLIKGAEKVIQRKSALIKKRVWDLLGSASANTANSHKGRFSEQDNCNFSHISCKILWGQK